MNFLFRQRNQRKDTQNSLISIDKFSEDENEQSNVQTSFLGSDMTKNLKPSNSSANNNNNCKSVLRIFTI